MIDSHNKMSLKKYNKRLTSYIYLSKLFNPNKCTVVITDSRFDTYVIVHQWHVHTKDFDLRSRVFDQHLTLDLCYMSYQLAC